MCSRLLGLIREQVFAGLFGAGKNLDAFLMAFRLPNLLRDLFAEARSRLRSLRHFHERSRRKATNPPGDLATSRNPDRSLMSAVTLLGIILRHN